MPGLRPLYIFDLDGTLAMIEHRRHFVENGRADWAEFYAACGDDKPNRAVIYTLASLLRSHNDVWIFSGRSDEVRNLTEYWLYNHTSFPVESMASSLVMRRAGDHTPDDELKRGWLLGMLDVDRKRLIAVFEDRDRLVKMWRSEGVPCFQVAPGEF